MKKICGLTLAFILLIGILSSCGEANMNPGITSIDLRDTTSTQQTWLGMPDSKLVINPDEYSGKSSSTNPAFAPLNIGILDDSGSVTKTLNDVMFLLETNSSNGLGGEVVFDGKWEGEGKNFSWNAKDLIVDPLPNGGVTYSIPAGHSSNAVAMTTKQVKLDMKMDNYLIVDVGECVGMVSFKGGPADQQGDFREAGVHQYYINDLLATANPKFNMERVYSATYVLYAIEPGNPVTINSYKFVSIPKGFHAARADDIQTTWAPFELMKNYTYDNNMQIEVRDFFADTNTIVRKITAVNPGMALLCGKFENGIKYDSKSGYLEAEVDGVKISINPKRKLNIKFYATEEDLLGDRNVSSEPTGNSGYWTVPLGQLKENDDLYLAVAMDSTLTFAELGELTKDRVSTTGSKKAYSETIEYWDAYLVANEIPSDYIIMEGVK